MMKTSLALTMSLVITCPVMAQSSGDWSGSYGFPSVTKQQSNLAQADLIAKREAGYYDNIGKNTINNFNTTSIGSLSQDDVTINGDGNTVTSTASNTGGLDSSINVQSIGLDSSSYTTTKQLTAPQ
jgi:hypothetical protein